MGQNETFLRRVMFFQKDMQPKRTAACLPLLSDIQRSELVNMTLQRNQDTQKHTFTWSDSVAILAIVAESLSPRKFGVGT